MKSKRFLCLLLVLLMVFSLAPSETRAETTVYFTAVNDQLLPDFPHHAQRGGTRGAYGQESVEQT